MSGVNGDASEGSAGNQRADSAAHRSSARLAGPAIGLALGIALGAWIAHPLAWPWLLGAGGLLAASLICRGRFARGRLALLCLAAVGLGAARLTIQQQLVAPDDLASRLGDAPTLVRVRGVALASPERRDRATGSMARFDYREPATYFPLRVESLVSRVGEETPTRGRVFVRVDGTVEPFHAGDSIAVAGFLRRPPRARNPGEFDVRAYARSTGQAGLLTVPGRDLVEITPAARGRLSRGWVRLRDTMRRRAGAWLLGDLPPTERGRRDALLAALLLGQREADLAGLDESFRRVGLAHLLAISGLHVGVLAGFVLLLVRAGGRPRRWHGWLLILVVLVYLLIVEARLPVLRAGVMTIAACGGLVIGRRLSITGLMALAALGLLLWRPDQLFTAGFQLSFGVVLALIHLAPAVRRRWFGRPDREAATVGRMAGQWLMGATAAAATAWLVAAPLVVFHFGLISPLAVPLSVLALPLVALLLACGYAKMLLALILPSAAMLAGLPLSILAELMISIVDAMDALPFASMHVPKPSIAWTTLAVGVVCWWALESSRMRRRLTWLALLVVGAWLLWPLRPWQSLPPLRVDMLSVGDGTCLLVRSRGVAVVFDAGSSTDLDAGRRTIVPALRELGVRGVDAIAVSHANLDHYSAVLEIVDAFDVGTVLVTSPFMSAAATDAFGPPAHLLDGLTQRRVSVVEVGAGAERGFGDAAWTWLHPVEEEVYRRANDGSMVIRVEAAGRSLLLCGDVQETGIGSLLARHQELQADLMELPHHGSFNAAAVRLVKQVQPSIVLQSTGWTRFSRDRWSSDLAGTERLVTVRDGACWVEVDDDGRVTTGRFLP